VDDIKKGQLGINAICICCDKRFQKGTQDYIQITFCDKCLSSYKPKGKETKDYQCVRTAIDLAYSRVENKPAPKKEKSILDYLK